MYGEFLYEMRFKLGVGGDVDTMPVGSRANFALTGEVRGPSIHGKIDGVYFALRQPEGWVSLLAHGFITTDSGDKVFVRVEGWAQKTPDEVDLFVLERIRFETISKELTWLNLTTGLASGFFDVKTGEGETQVYGIEDTWTIEYNPEDEEGDEFAPPPGESVLKYEARINDVVLEECSQA